MSITLGVLLALLIAAALIVLVPAYAALLRRLEAENPDDFEALGRPSFWNASPRKSLALQRFVYGGWRSRRTSPELARQCRFVGVATPFFVIPILVLVLAALVLVARELLRLAH